MCAVPTGCHVRALQIIDQRGSLLRIYGDTKRLEDEFPRTEEENASLISENKGLQVSVGTMRQMVTGGDHVARCERF